MPKTTGGAELVGVARLILTRGSNERYSAYTKYTANVSSSLQDLLRRSQLKYAQFPLPIFHTLCLNELMRRAAQSAQPWGELSRVIVAPEWRGRGISRKLVEHALSHADRLRADVLLECLNVHKSLYEDLGFNFLGERGEVMGVGKTMTGMVRVCPRRSPIA